jgi:hypothetical protein
MNVELVSALISSKPLDGDNIVDLTTSTPWQLDIDLRTLGQLARRWHKRLFAKPLAKIATRV